MKEKDSKVQGKIIIEEKAKNNDLNNKKEKEKKKEEKKEEKYECFKIRCK